MSSDNDAFRTQIRNQFVKRLVNEFIDVIIMSHFQSNPFSGYDVLLFAKIHLEIPLSPGNVYSTIYAMEQKGLLRVLSKNSRRTTFGVTEKGKEAAEVLTDPSEMQGFISKIMQGGPLLK
jgi:DNA-binding PadR family transcriptional regulator